MSEKRREDGWTVVGKSRKSKTPAKSAPAKTGTKPKPKPRPSSPPPSSPSKTPAPSRSLAPSLAIPKLPPPVTKPVPSVPKPTVSSTPVLRCEKPKPKPEPKSTPTPTAKAPTSFGEIKERGYPLGFASQEQLNACLDDLDAVLTDAFKESGVSGKIEGYGVRGSAATYESRNPRKKGKVFGKTSDIDMFVVFNGRLPDVRPSAAGFFHPDKVFQQFPALKSWSAEWSKTLGHEITPGIFRSNADAFAEEYLGY